MADIRIKDLATTATTTASDDFMAVDGATNGTRKLSAATPAFLTSVTTPSLTSPAATNLTLGTGTSGAAVTVLSASNNVGIGTTGPTGKLHVNGLSTVAGSSMKLQGAVGVPIVFFSDNADVNNRNWGITSNGSAYGTFEIWGSTAAGGEPFLGTSRFSIDKTGTVSIASTTAGSFGAGALVVQGGISAGNTGAASYFGAAVSVAGAVTAAGTIIQVGATTGYQWYKDSTPTKAWGLGSNGFAGLSTADGDFQIGTYNGSAWAQRLVIANATGAATFAGTVAIGNTVNTVSPTSPNRTVTMVVNGVTLYLAAKTTND